MLNKTCVVHVSTLLGVEGAELPSRMTLLGSKRQAINYLCAFIPRPLIVSYLRQLLFSRFHLLIGYMMGLEFRKEQPARFHVVRRETGERLLDIYTSDAFLSFHHINAYEEAGHLVIDMCVYEDGTIVSSINLKDLKKGVVPERFGEARRFLFPVDEEVFVYVLFN